MVCLILFSSCGVYTFRDVSIDYSKIKTVKIGFIDNKAAYVNPQLSPRLTDNIKQKINNYTKLTLVNSDDANYIITGFVNRYNLSLSAISNNQSSGNRLTVGASITFINTVDNKTDNFTVTRDFDFSSQLSLQQAEGQLLSDIVNQLTDQIFKSYFFKLVENSIFHRNYHRMVSSAEDIVQNFFQTSSLENVTEEDLISLTNNYPFYAAAHFLLAKKLYKSNAVNTDAVLQKTALHFKNNSWLNFLLNEEQLSHSIDETVAEVVPQQNQEIIIEQRNDNDIAEPYDEEVFAAEEDFTEDTILSSRLSGMLKETAASFEKPISPIEEIPIETTPYHRVDYFDSQGIKLDEEKANDKLGTQLKRFTDWLKQMKRVNVNPADIKPDEAGEQQVENIAATSNEAGEVVTETMADVLIKQGKPDQAIEIYEKLSFNNPSKSAYFAAKIQELKS